VGFAFPWLVGSDVREMKWIRADEHMSRAEPEVDEGYVSYVDLAER